MRSACGWAKRSGGSPKAEVSFRVLIAQVGKMDLNWSMCKEKHWETERLFGYHESINDIASIIATSSATNVALTDSYAFP